MKKVITYSKTLAELHDDDGLSYAKIGAMLNVSATAARKMHVEGRDIYCKHIEGTWHILEVKDWWRPVRGSMQQA